MAAEKATASSSHEEKKPVHITETPITLSNWYKHVNWLNCTLILFIPLYGCIHAYFVPLQLKTAIWAVWYYYLTGIGITAGEYMHRLRWKWEDKTDCFQDITVYGLTARTPLVFPCVSTSLPLAVVPSKAPLDGGLVITVLTTDTPTPTRTPTPSARVSSTPTWDGWS